MKFPRHEPDSFFMDDSQGPVESWSIADTLALAALLAFIGYMILRWVL